MRYITDWIIGGFLPNGKVRVIRLDGDGWKQEKIINVNEMQNINKIQEEK